MSASDDEGREDPDYAVPLQHRRAFGAGIKRKRFVEFVAASPAETPTPHTPKKPAGDVYLSIVLPDKDLKISSNSTANTPTTPAPDASTDPPSETQIPPLCPVCSLPVSSTTRTTHSATLAHQVCLPHAHPPSAIERGRKGLSMLTSYGWDPDAREGLGKGGHGRLHPVRAKARDGKEGIGVEARTASVPGSVNGRVKEEVKKGQEDRKAKAKREKDGRTREKKMRALIFGRDEVNEYLGLRL